MQTTFLNPLLSLIDFIIACTKLDDAKIDISPLLTEFKRTATKSELTHSVSLSFVSFKYAQKGYPLSFFPPSDSTKNPDLEISGIKGDIKVIQPTDSFERHSEKGNDFTTKLADDLCYDIGTAIRERASKGIKQAELLFIDLGSKSPIWLTLKEKTVLYTDRLPEPKKYRIIYFWKYHHTNYSENQFPFSFYGFYIDIEECIWNYIQNDTTIISHQLRNIGENP